MLPERTVTRTSIIRVDRGMILGGLQHGSASGGVGSELTAAAKGGGLSPDSCNSPRANYSTLYSGERKPLSLILEKLPRCHDIYETRILLQLIPYHSATFTRKKGLAF
jgi:hypothetical protein